MGRAGGRADCRLCPARRQELENREVDGDAPEDEEYGEDGGADGAGEAKAGEGGAAGDEDDDEDDKEDLMG